MYFSSKEKRPRILSQPPFLRVRRIYCSPAEASLPQRALLPHNALLPHRALLPHNALLPQSAFDPHNALEPQRALLPHKALLPATLPLLVLFIVDAGAPTTNWDVPHTAAFDQVDDVFQTAVELSLR